MKTIKLNYRHSLKTMNAQLKGHGETVHCYGQAGNIIHEVRSHGDTVVSFNNARDCAEYINERNGIE